MRFVSLGVSGEEDASGEAVVDRVKSLGKWEVEIAVVGRGSGVEPVRKVVEVVAGE